MMMQYAAAELHASPRTPGGPAGGPDALRLSFAEWLGPVLWEAYGGHFAQHGFDSQEVLLTLTEAQLEHMLTTCVPMAKLGHRFLFANKLHALREALGVVSPGFFAASPQAVATPAKAPQPSPAPQSSRGQAPSPRPAAQRRPSATTKSPAPPAESEEESQRKWVPRPTARPRAPPAAKRRVPSRAAGAASSGTPEPAANAGTTQAALSRGGSFTATPTPQPRAASSSQPAPLSPRPALFDPLQQEDSDPERTRREAARRNHGGRRSFPDVAPTAPADEAQAPGLRSPKARPVPRRGSSLNLRGAAAFQPPEAYVLSGAPHRTQSFTAAEWTSRAIPAGGVSPPLSPGAQSAASAVTFVGEDRRGSAASTAAPSPDTPDVPDPEDPAGFTRLLQVLQHTNALAAHSKARGPMTGTSPSPASPYRVEEHMPARPSLQRPRMTPISVLSDGLVSTPPPPPA